MRTHATFIAATLAAAVSTHAVAQKPPADPYPVKPISIVIPFAAGGSTDGEARLYTEKVATSIGQPFVFDFRPGAASSIGVGYVVKAVPDGYTLLLANSSSSVFPHFYPNMNESMVKTLELITQLCNRLTIAVVSPAALPNVHTLADLQAWGRANPGQAQLQHLRRRQHHPHRLRGHGRRTEGAHQGRPLQGRRAGANRPYRRAHAGVSRHAALQHPAGQAGAAAPHRHAGQRALHAASGPAHLARAGLQHRLPQLDRPVRPAGHAPGHHPPPQCRVRQAVPQPDVLKAMDAQGSLPVASSPEESRKKFAGELAYWKRIIQDNVTLDE